MPDTSTLLAGAATAPPVRTEPATLEEAVTSASFPSPALVLALAFLAPPPPLSESLDELDLSASGGEPLPPEEEPPPIIPPSESKLRPKELLPKLTRAELSELFPLPLLLPLPLLPEPPAEALLDDPTPMLDDLRRRPLTRLRLRGRPRELSELPLLFGAEVLVPLLPAAAALSRSSSLHRLAARAGRRRLC